MSPTSWYVAHEMHGYLSLRNKKRTKIFFMGCNKEDKKNSDILTKFASFCDQKVSYDQLYDSLISFHYPRCWSLAKFINDNNLWDKSLDEIIILFKLIKES